MKKTYYKKVKRRNFRKIIRFFGLGVAIFGFILGLYIFFPIISWEVYLKPVLANQQFASPIPTSSVISSDNIKSLISSTVHTIDDKNAQSWVPSSYKQNKADLPVKTYYLTIPKLSIEDAVVSTVDTNLSRHLVHFPGTALPGTPGTAVIFGHSTLPQLFNPTDYTTIFANIQNLVIGNTLVVGINNKQFTYKIQSIAITNADDTSYLAQKYSNSHLIIVTCTPPGTTWKRLIIRSELVKI